jgi:hypothetical protein
MKKPSFAHGDFPRIKAHAICWKSAEAIVVALDALYGALPSIPAMLAKYRHVVVPPAHRIPPMAKRNCSCGYILDLLSPSILDIGYLGD